MVLNTMLESSGHAHIEIMPSGMAAPSTRERAATVNFQKEIGLRLGRTKCRLEFMKKSAVVAVAHGTRWREGQTVETAGSR
jgi:hypothetical protein